MSKRILVTGSDGFVARYLIDALKAEKKAIATFDVGDGDIASDVLDFGGLDHVFHLAALTFVPYSWENPKEFYRVNVLGTETVLELCRKNGCSMTLMSTYIYGAPQYLPVDERHPVAPNSPYNHSKYLTEQLCFFYESSFGVHTTILRPFNIYGFGQAGQFLIPEIVTQMLNPDVPELHLQSLTPKRDYVYIGDVVRALMLSIGQPRTEAYNIASGTSVSVGELASLVMDVGGIKKPVVGAGKERKNEITDICGDITKANRMLGWRPEISLEQGLSLMIEAAR